MDKPSPTFLRLAAICSLLSVATTLILIFGPNLYAPVPDGLAGRMQRVEDPAYLFRAWIYLATRSSCSRPLRA